VRVPFTWPRSIDSLSVVVASKVRTPDAPSLGSRNRARSRTVAIMRKVTGCPTGPPSGRPGRSASTARCRRKAGGFTRRGARLTLTAQADPLGVRSGQPVTFRMIATGSRTCRDLRLPRLGAIRGCAPSPRRLTRSRSSAPGERDPHSRAAPGSRRTGAVEIPPSDGDLDPRRSRPDRCGRIDRGACGAAQVGQPGLDPSDRTSRGRRRSPHRLRLGSVQRSAPPWAEPCSGGLGLPPFGLALVWASPVSAILQEIREPGGSVAGAQRQSACAALGLLQRGESVAFYTEIARAVTCTWRTSRRGGAGLTRDELAAALSARGIRRRRCAGCCAFSTTRPCPLGRVAARRRRGKRCWAVPTSAQRAGSGERVTLLLALLVAAAEPPGTQLFADANAAYLSGDMSRAVAAWEALVSEGVAATELETNLGAAYLRQGKRGLAALHFERALFLDPGDDDARADLIELRRGNVDRWRERRGRWDRDGGAAAQAIARIHGGVCARRALGRGWVLVGVALLRGGPAGLRLPPRPVSPERSSRRS